MGPKIALKHLYFQGQQVLDTEYSLTVEVLFFNCAVSVQ